MSNVDGHMILYCAQLGSQIGCKTQSTHLPHDGLLNRLQDHQHLLIETNPSNASLAISMNIVII